MAYKYYELPVCYMGSGLELKLPVHELSGGDGITVGITACIHGDETIGVEIVRRVVEKLKETKIKGTVRVMPVANPLGFEQGKRNTPIDMTNMNRIFPGRYNGSLTEVQARVIADKFLAGLNAYIDVHAGGQDPVVDYVYATNDEGFSRSFLSKILYTPSNPYPGTSATYTLPHDISTVTIECGGGPNALYYVEKGVKGIWNMLKYKGVVEGEPEKRDDQIHIGHIEHVNPRHAGLYVPCFTYESMNTIIEGKGVVLGRIYNPMTLELLEELKTPYERNLMILMRCDINVILVGDFTFMIGDLNSEIKK